MHEHLCVPVLGHVQASRLCTVSWGRGRGVCWYCCHTTACPPPFFLPSCQQGVSLLHNFSLPCNSLFKTCFFFLFSLSSPLSLYRMSLSQSLSFRLSLAPHLSLSLSIYLLMNLCLPNRISLSLSQPRSLQHVISLTAYQRLHQHSSSRLSARSIPEAVDMGSDMEVHRVPIFHTFHLTSPMAQSVRGMKLTELRSAVLLDIDVW